MKAMVFFGRSKNAISILFQEKFPVFRVFLFIFGALLFSVLFASSVSAATPPSIITYQGKLLDDGTAVNATTSIQLRIYDDPAAGSLLYTAGGTIGAPADIEVPVDNGIFSVNMGAAGTNNVTTTVFASNATLYLEVWVEGNQMSPRKRLNSVPYALNSAYLMGYGAATVSTTTYIPVSDESGNFNFSGSIIATGTATSSFTNVLVNDGITLGGEKRTTWPVGGGDVLSTGVNTFTNTNTFVGGVVNIKGNIVTPTLASTLNFGAGFGGMDVVVSDQYAYVINGDDGLRIVDISDPVNPVTVGHENSNPFSANSVAVVGNYAYVTYQDGMYAIDITDPSNPQLLGAGGVGAGGPIAIAGNYAYVVDDFVGFTSIDISDPNNLRVLDTVDSPAGNLNGIDIQGKYAYIVDRDNGLLIIDISDPKNLVQVGAVDNGQGYHVIVKGRYAYVANSGDVSIDIIDISDPTAPVELASFNDLEAGESVQDFMLAENYLFVAPNTHEPLILDIASSTNPVRVSVFGSILVGGTTQDIFLSGNYIYLTAQVTRALKIVDISGAKVSNANVGTLKVGNIDSTGITQFQRSVSIRGGLNVGNSGLLLNGDFSMTTATNSVFATNTLRFTNTTLFETTAVVTDTHAFIFNTANAFSNASTTYLFSVRNNGTPAFSISGNGNVHATGSYYGVSANLGTPGAPGDLAERVDIAQDDVVEPGDVVVVDPNSTDTYRRSNSPYAQEVSGVISTNPTIVVGNGRTEHTAVMAMVGRVPIKVSTENGPIVRGDLLITASSTGYAMRYDPTKEISPHVAGIVGVALESLRDGKGKIMGLVRTGWINGQDQQIFSEMRNEISRLALGQSRGSDFDIGEDSEGNIIRVENDLDLNGFSLLSVRSIKGLNEKWEIDEEGRFTTTVETREGAKTLYALQSGESQYVFSGQSTLVNGHVRIDFDDTILDIVDVDMPMSINLTLTQKAKGLFVESRDEEGFDVQEIGGGESNATFDWLIFATRKNAPVVDEEPDEEDEPVVDDDQPVEDENSNGDGGNNQVADPEENSEVVDEGDENLPPAQEQEEGVVEEENGEEVNEDEPMVDDPAGEPIVEEQPAPVPEPINDPPPAEVAPTE